MYIKQAFISCSRTFGVLCLFLLFTLTGCFNQQGRLSSLFIKNGEQQKESPLITNEEADQELIISDSEICLKQELEALGKTGEWLKSLPPPEERNAKAQYDFPITRNKQVEMYLTLFQGKQRKQFRRWLARSTYYAPIIQAELKQTGLPQDLLYLSMIESGFNQRAYSRSRAVGLWQFMAGTGKQYNLRINRYIDERRDVIKSTRAAASYLHDLYQEFGDWHLAVAAYNGGPGKIRNGLKKYKVDNFWDLAQKKYLRLETKRYVPKLIAALIIAKEPEKYGFYDINYSKPLEYDQLEVGPGLSFQAIALLSGSSEKTIRTLNMELRQSKTPLDQKSYVVKIPKGTLALASANMKRLHSVVDTGYKIHIYRSNEKISSICRKYNINKATLFKVNNLSSSGPTNGQKLKIPHTVVSYHLLPEGNKDALTAYKDSLILHKIKKGESISSISRKYGVPADQIVLWNGLKSVHKIRAGQQLALYVNQQSPVEQSAMEQPILPPVSTQGEIIVLASTSKWLPSQKKEDNVKWYRVKQGDSLWTISRKFNTSPSRIKQWNNLKSNLIHPGKKLKLINV